MRLLQTNKLYVQNDVGQNGGKLRPDNELLSVWFFTESDGAQYEARKTDERKEERLITITEGNALNELDFVFIPSSLPVEIGKEA